MLGRCVILGGAGFLGQTLLRLLLSQGAQVCVVDRADRCAGLHRLPVVLVPTGELTAEALAESIHAQDIVFHLWSDGPNNASENQKIGLIRAVLRTGLVLERCARARIRQIVFASSGGAVYGPGKKPISESRTVRPVSNYGLMKLAEERCFEAHHRRLGLKYRILRIANVYGPGVPLHGEHNVIGAFLACAARKRPATLWGGGAAIRDYVYSEDVAQAFLRAGCASTPSRVFNIGTGVGTSVRDLVGQIQAVTGLSFAGRSQPRRPGGLSYNVLDCTRAAKELGWRHQVSLRDGLHKTWQWICERGAVAPRPELCPEILQEESHEDRGSSVFA